jgi:hypothetical protein
MQEPGVGVCRFALTLRDARLHPTWEPVAICSLHALARRLERGADRSHDALFRDLCTLAVVADHDRERVAASDGYWIGDLREMKGRAGVSKVLNVRTWHE